MKIIAIDTNVLLDFLLKRHPRFNEVKRLFEDCAERKIEIFVPQVVFPEIEWVLRSHYKESKEKVVRFLEELLAMDGIILENKPEIQKAVSIYKYANIKFTDSVIAAQIQRIKPDEFLTFDEDLHKFYQKMDWE